MSKAALKKELENLSREQLIEVIGAAYSSSKEARAYFEFFLNPDADALLDNKIDIISKELARAKRGYSKARITVIRKAIRDFSSFGVGDEYIGRLMYAAIRMIAGMEGYYYYPATLTNGVLKLVEEYIALSDRNASIGEAMANIERLENENIGRPAMRSRIMETARHAISGQTSLKPIKTNAKKR